MHTMIIKIYNHTNTYIFDCLSGQGKIEISQGKNREKSVNFDILCEWQPCIILYSLSKYTWTSYRYH